jgi:UDPglucose--hexose-1-phosphate uridylyltransferase
MTFFNQPHRRYNPLTGEWVQVSPNRTQRPWQGQVEKTEISLKSGYDASCYLCPGNVRAGGIKNPQYRYTFAFNNDYSSLLPDTPAAELNEHELLIAHTERGVCRVICYSPRHDLTLPEMQVEEIRRIVDTWISEYNDLGSENFINYVQIFENKGEIMGCSNPHPHGQIWAQQTLPDVVRKELHQQTVFFKKNGETLLSAYLGHELKIGDRIVTQNEDFVVLVPFWAVWPFETIIISRRSVAGFSDLTEHEKYSLADIIRQITIRYDNIFNISFPYTAGFHPAPTDGFPHPEWHFHMHFYPPLLRSATVKKFMVGYEMLGNAQRDITPESAAGILRELPGTHYKKE